MTAQAGRVALVTGGNKGIGYEVVRRLARAGITSLIGCRDLARGTLAAEALAREGLTARPYLVDVTDRTSIDACAAAVAKDFGRVDILVNNAAIGLFISPPGSLPASELRTVFETNFFGPLHMIQAFLPMLRRSNAGRIVNVSSEVGCLMQQSNPQSTYYGKFYSAYSMSKTLLNALSVQVSAELIATPIKVNSVCPGLTATDMTRELGNVGHNAECASEVIFKYAVVGPEGPTGGFYNRVGPLAW